MPYVLDGPEWENEIVTWSFADIDIAGDPFDSSILAQNFRTEIRAAFARWDAVADIDFRELSDSASSNIRLGMGEVSFEHASSGIWGEAEYYYRNNFITEGTIVFEIETPVSNNAYYKLALHEIGHIIGLGHSPSATDIMHPMVDTATGLSADDIAGVRALYGAETSKPLSVADLLSKPSSETLKELVDFDGNHLGGVGSWKRIGQADVQKDGDLEYILVNPEIGRWATLGPDPSGMIDLANHGQGGDTRVVGIYIDPLVTSGVVAKGSPHDSQTRFAHDLKTDNLSTVLGAGDYDKDGLQEVYFRTADKTAYLHAYMHADGNIQYANYQNASQMQDFLSSHGHGSEYWGSWVA